MCISLRGGTISALGDESELSGRNISLKRGHTIYTRKYSEKPLFIIRDGDDYESWDGGSNTGVTIAQFEVFLMPGMRRSTPACTSQ